MAKYINPVATGLEIGQGEAQVFDTSGIWAAKLGAIKEAKAEKEKKEKELLDSIVDIDTSRFHSFNKSTHAFWANKWIFIRLFCGLIEFKFHLTNYTHGRAWYYGTGVRFRVSICGIFKTHLIFNIGPNANEH